MDNEIIELGSCYEILETVEGKRRIVGPIQSYGFYFKDERGFMYMKEGIYFMGDRPERNIIFPKVPCIIGDRKKK